MTVTNKPNDGEPIVLKVVDPIFGEKFIATPVFWRFLDELGGQAEASEYNEAASLAGVRARLSKVESDSEPNPFTIDSTGWTIDTTQITIDMVNA